MKKLIVILCAVFLPVLFAGCAIKTNTPKIGVALGVGPALRWQQEKTYMEEYAHELKINIEVRLNADENVKPFHQDCIELIDSNIDVLIVRARNLFNMQEILDYAAQKQVKVICYAGLIFGTKVDLFIGHDCLYIGQRMGQYLAETVDRGDYIILSGEPSDKNVTDLIYAGAMKYIQPLGNRIQILLDAPVPGWSAEAAKNLVREAIIKNGNSVDAILAPNDKIAGACAEVITELGVTKPVAITGMDAETEALKRISDGTQSCTVYMNLQTLARTAVRQAVRMAKNKKPFVNYELDNESGELIPSFLITGQLIVKENLTKFFPDI